MTHKKYYISQTSGPCLITAARDLLGTVYFHNAGVYSQSSGKQGRLATARPSGTNSEYPAIMARGCMLHVEGTRPDANVFIFMKPIFTCNLG